MLNNVKLKKALKNTIFPVLTQVNKFIPKKDEYIMLYSANMGIRHNLKPLKDYLLENKYDEKYKIICAVENMSYAEKEDRVKYIPSWKAILYFFITKHVFYTTGQIPIKPSKKQIVIQLDHGTTGIKTIGALSKINNGDEFFFTYYPAPSEIYIPIVEKEFLCDKKNIIVNGEPVNDLLFKEHKPYDLGDFDKVGLWTPTFRQSDYLNYSDSSEELLPMFTQEDYEELNEELKKYNFKLIVKLHPGQNLDKYENLSYSHLEILSDKEFNKKELELYPLLTQVDFVLGDYSSVFLQYLLLDRPMGFVIPDFEEYKERRGFVFDNVLDYMPGPKFTKKEELYKFFKDLHNDEDNYKEERKEVCNVIHKYHDGNNCERILSFSNIFK